LAGYLPTDIKTELHRERKRLLVFTHVLTLVIYGFFIPYDFFIEAKPDAALLELAVFSVLLFNLYLLIRLELMILSALIILILVSLEILISIVDVIDQTIVVKELYWTMVIAPAAFYLTGRGRGIVIAATMFVLTWGIYVYFKAQGTTALTPKVMIDYSGVYLVIATISFLYSRSQSLNIKRMLHYSQDLAFANDELKVAALTDTLTCSYNRKFLDELLHELTTNRRQIIFSLIMMDIDHFKNVNDDHGHQVGDDILSTVTKELQKRLRDNDILGRWGGEEFIIISQGLDANTAFSLAERLRKYIEDFEFPHKLKITCSFGVVEWRGHETKAELIKRADNALYKAKKSGRNQCVLFE
jgi:diguanylate cyclase (GGDEF)-like protein